MNLLSFSIGFDENDLVVQRFKDQSSGCLLFKSVDVVNCLEHDYIKSVREGFHAYAVNHRGYGYWYWKPFIVMSKLNRLKDGEILLYADIGCEFSKFGDAQLLDFMDLLDQQSIVANITNKRYTEEMYTKKSLLDQFQLEVSDVKSPQIAATWILMKVDDDSRRFVKEWLDLCGVNRFKNIDDSLTNREEPQFIEHRHDQSVFSCLFKRYGFVPLRVRDWFPAYLYYQGSPVAFNFIHALRNRTKNTVLLDRFYPPVPSLVSRLYYEFRFLFFRVYDRLFR